MTLSLGVIYSTSTGNTEHVINVLIERIQESFGAKVHIIKKRAEQVEAEELTSFDVLVLACGSWNTENIEGQLQPYMFDLCTKRAKDIDLTGKRVAAIGLGDDRYYFTARAAEKLTEFLEEKQATVLLPTLKIVNDPYGQEERISAWAMELCDAMKKIPPTVE
jgi:flavodoxin I